MTGMIVESTDRVDNLNQRHSVSLIESDLGPRREKFVNDIKLLSRKTTLAKLCQHSKTISQSSTNDIKYEILTACPPRSSPLPYKSHQAQSSSSETYLTNSTLHSVECPSLSGRSSHVSYLSNESQLLDTPCSLSERIPFPLHSRSTSIPVTTSSSRNNLNLLSKGDRTPKFLRRIKKLLRFPSSP